ncbi:hypothetical protein AAVH_15540 [Aphelenchoides avenae]|nr:hypothetical protein AAVH_15540 [Aphelenchus avenae]
MCVGSSTGIGRDAALGYAREGASVTFHGQSMDRLMTKDARHRMDIDQGKVLTIRGPIQEMKTIHALVDKTVERFGRIDVLINNAGVMKKPDVSLKEMEGNKITENFDYIFDVNVKSMLFLTDYAAPYLGKTTGNVVSE